MKWNEFENTKTPKPVNQSKTPKTTSKPKEYTDISVTAQSEKNVKSGGFAIVITLVLFFGLFLLAIGMNV